MKPGIGFPVCSRFIAILAIAMGACSREPGVPCGNDRCPEGYGCEQDRCVLPALYGVWSSGPGNVFALGQAGTVLHYDGYSWQEMASPTHASLHGVWGSGPGNVFVVGQAGTILHYDRQSWQQMAFPIDPPVPGVTGGSIIKVWDSGLEDIFAVGHSYLLQGLVLRYDVQSWQVTASTNGWLKAVWGSGSDDVFVVGWSYAGDRAIALHYDGQSWRDLQFPGDPIWPEAVWESGPDAVPVWSMAPNGTAHPHMCPWLATIGDVRSIGRGDARASTVSDRLAGLLPGREW